MLKIPEYLEIRNEGTIHNNGIFATKPIAKGAKVIEYVGEKITKGEANRRITKIEKNAQKKGILHSVYIFELNKSMDIDGDVDYNPAKYINHSCNPNCEVDIFRGHIWIIALRDIKKGEEITYNYMFDFNPDDYESYPCECGYDKCVNYIVAHTDWPKLKEHLETIKTNS